MDMDGWISNFLLLQLMSTVLHYNKSEFIHISVGVIPL